MNSRSSAIRRSCASTASPCPPACLPVLRRASEVFVARDGNFLGWIVIADAVRPEAAHATKSIHAMGIKTILLTGDACGIHPRGIRAHVHSEFRASATRSIRCTATTACAPSKVLNGACGGPRKGLAMFVSASALLPMTLRKNLSYASGTAATDSAVNNSAQWPVPGGLKRTTAT